MLEYSCGGSCVCAYVPTVFHMSVFSCGSVHIWCVHVDVHAGMYKCIQRS